MSDLHAVFLALLGGCVHGGGCVEAADRGPSSASHRCASPHAVMPPFKTETRSNPES